MFLLEECLKLYKDNFPVEWIDKFSWEDADVENSYTMASMKIKQFQKNCFIYLSKSAHSGEYVSSKEKVENVCDELEKILTNEYSHDYKRKFRERIIRMYESLDKEILVCISYYLGLLSFVADKTDCIDHNILFNDLEGPDGDYIESVLSDFIKYVVPSCQMDHLLSNDRSLISDLIFLRNNLEKKRKNDGDKNIQAVYMTLFYKCSFLLKKHICVFGASEYRNKSKLIRVKNEDIDVGFLRPLYDNFFVLNSNEYDHSLVRQWQNNCNDTINNKLSEFILLMKYYQKESGNHQQVNNLVRQFNGVYSKLTRKGKRRPFDEHAIYTLRNYLQNCRFSFLLSHGNYGYEELEKDLKKIENIQNETSIYNFYPYQKATEFIIKDLSECMDREEISIRRELVTKKLNLLSECLKKCSFALDWCRKHSYYPFQMVYAECCTFCPDLSIPIFVASSFSKPLEYKKHYDILEKHKRSFDGLTAKAFFVKEKESIEKLKEQMNRTEKRYIEIIGAFTAIITFLFTCVNLFSSKTEMTAKDMLKNTAVFGIILLLFVNAIFFISTPKHELLKHPRSYILLGCTVAYVVILRDLLLRLVGW